MFVCLGERVFVLQVDDILQIDLHLFCLSAIVVFVRESKGNDRKGDRMTREEMLTIVNVLRDEHASWKKCLDQGKGTDQEAIVTSACNAGMSTVDNVIERLALMGLFTKVTK